MRAPVHGYAGITGLRPAASASETQTQETPTLTSEKLAPECAQVVLLIGQAFLLGGALHVKSQEGMQWHEPSQISREAHESMVVAVVVRQGADGTPEVWTRKRPAHTDGRNQMYVGRWEALAKPLQHGECPMRAIQEPFRDHFDLTEHTDFQKVRVMGMHKEDVNIVLTTTPSFSECTDQTLTPHELKTCKEARKKYVPSIF